MQMVDEKCVKTFLCLQKNIKVYYCNVCFLTADFKHEHNPLNTCTHIGREHLSSISASSSGQCQWHWPHVCSFEKRQCNQAYVWLKTHSSARSLCLWVTRLDPTTRADPLFPRKPQRRNIYRALCRKPLVPSLSWKSILSENVLADCRTWCLHHFPQVNSSHPFFYST